MTPPGKKLGSAVIEVIKFGHEAVPGLKPVNIALSIEIDDVGSWHDN